MGDTIAVMDKGEVLQAGTPEEVYDRPATMFVAGFIGSPAMNFLPAQGSFAPQTERLQVNGASVPVPRLHEGLEHDDARLGARPEHIFLADSSELRGRVFGVEYMGARQLLTIDTSAGRLKVRTPNTVHARMGETVGLAFKTDSLVVFDGQSQRALASDLMARASHG